MGFLVYGRIGIALRNAIYCAPVLDAASSSLVGDLSELRLSGPTTAAQQPATAYGGAPVAAAAAPGYPAAAPAAAAAAPPPQPAGPQLMINKPRKWGAQQQFEAPARPGAVAGPSTAAAGGLSLTLGEGSVHPLKHLL